MKPIAMYAFWLILIIAGILLAYLWGARSLFSDATSSTPGTVAIRGQEFAVEVRDTALGRAQGLSGRTSLAPDTGMLFIFATPGDYGFWMKDMQFPIDIIWIEDGKVAGVSEQLMPEPEKNILTLTVYHPPQPVRYILEVPAGTVAQYGIQAGDAVRLPR